MVIIFSITYDMLDIKDNNGTLHLVVLGLYQNIKYTWKIIAKKVVNGVHGPKEVNVPVVVVVESRIKPEDV